MSGWFFLLLVLLLFSAPERNPRNAPWIAWAIAVVAVCAAGLIEHQGWPG